MAKIVTQDVVLVFSKLTKAGTKVDEVISTEKLKELQDALDGLYSEDDPSMVVEIKGLDDSNNEE